MTKPTASLSLDLDNQWSYMKSRGESGWVRFPSYLKVAVPRILYLLDELDLRMTFFVSGQDAALEKNADHLTSLSEAGHEVANHSFSNELDVRRCSKGQVEDEVCRGEEAIEKVTGVRPRGWRSPGFTHSSTLIQVLSERGYRYDSSIYPSSLGAMAKVYHTAKLGVDRKEKGLIKHLYGGTRDGLKPLQPFEWELKEDTGLLEIPVTPVPYIRTPFHGSYLHCLAGRSPFFAKAYLRTAIELCRLSKTSPSLLLQATDFLGKDDLSDMQYFPAMERRADEKIWLMREALSQLKQHFDPVPMGDQAERIRTSAPSLVHIELPVSRAAA